MKQIGQKFSLSRRKRGFEHSSVLTTLDCLVFPSRIGLNLVAGPTRNGRLVQWSRLFLFGYRTSTHKPR